MTIFENVVATAHFLRSAAAYSRAVGRRARFEEKTLVVLRERFGDGRPGERQRGGGGGAPTSIALAANS